MSKADEPAFPVPETALGGQQMRGGLSKREYFAAQIMASMMTVSHFHRPWWKFWGPKSWAESVGNLHAISARSASAADALIAELEKEHR